MSTPKPQLRTIAPNTVQVRFAGQTLGTLSMNAAGVWVGTHSDGTPGPGAWTKIDAAWALINA